MVFRLISLAHVHLLLNHFPTVGFGIGLALFLVALAVRNEPMKRAGLVIFFLMALITIATYVSGNAAESVIKGRPDVSQALIREHEGAAFWGYLFMEITGFMAWLGLWRFRVIKRLTTWNLAAVLVLSILTFVTMMRAADLGSGERVGYGEGYRFVRE
jgi:uncharacterized membrane protein